MKNKVILIAVLLFCFQKSSIGQKIQFKCYVKSSCKDTVELLQEYSLKGNDTTYYSTNGICWIEDLGDYVFYSEQITIGVQPIIFKFTSFQSQILDTIQKPVLYSILVTKKGTNFKTGDWVYCGMIANGFKCDYYINGQKRIEGKFKRGKPIGELKFYSKEGKLEYTEYYNKKGKKIKSEYVSS